MRPFGAPSQRGGLPPASFEMNGIVKPTTPPTAPALPELPSCTEQARVHTPEIEGKSPFMLRIAGRGGGVTAESVLEPEPEGELLLPGSRTGGYVNAGLVLAQNLQQRGGEGLKIRIQGPEFSIVHHLSWIGFSRHWNAAERVEVTRFWPTQTP